MRWWPLTIKISIFSICPTMAAIWMYILSWIPTWVCFAIQFHQHLTTFAWSIPVFRGQTLVWLQESQILYIIWPETKICSAPQKHRPMISPFFGKPGKPIFSVSNHGGFTCSDQPWPPEDWYPGNTWPWRAPAADLWACPAWRRWRAASPSRLAIPKPTEWSTQNLLVKIHLTQNQIPLYIATCNTDSYRMGESAHVLPIDTHVYEVVGETPQRSLIWPC